MLDSCIQRESRTQLRVSASGPMLLIANYSAELQQSARSRDLLVASKLGLICPSSLLRQQLREKACDIVITTCVAGARIFQRV